MTQYTLQIHDPATRLASAQICLGYINKAFAAGTVKEGPGLIRKHTEAKAKMVELEAQIDALSKDNMQLPAKIELMAQGIKF